METIQLQLRCLGQPPAGWRAAFVRSHAHLIAAADFLATEAWTVRGLVRHLTLFFVDIATRRVRSAGTTTNPTSVWMEQMARNVTDCDTGVLRDKWFLVIDRDAVFSPRFKSILGSADVGIPLTAYQMNAACRAIRTINPLGVPGSDDLRREGFPGESHR